MVKNLTANVGGLKRCGFDPWVGEIPWRREWQPTPVFLPGESHGQKSLVGYGAIGLQSIRHKQLGTHTSGLYIFRSHAYWECLQALENKLSWNSETAHFTQLTYFSAQLTLFCCCLFPVGENLLLQPMYFWCNYHFRVGMYLLLLLLSHFSRIRLCATP